MADKKGNTFAAQVIQQIREGEQITLSATVDSADHFKDFLIKAENAIKVRKDQFKKELEAHQAEVLAKAKAAQEQDNKQGQ
jgi:hypothetical protein